MSLNKVMLQGRMCSDVEVKQIPSGASVASFRIAVDHDKKNKDTGERGCDFINIVAWRESAEFVGKWFKKGDPILVVGRLQVREYIDKEGNKRSANEVTLESAYFCGPKKEEQNNSYYAPAGAFSPLDDDGPIPF